MSLTNLRFSQSSPDSRAYYGDGVRPQYDFGIAYPDPRSVPALELSEALRIGADSEGQDLALYPGIQGYKPLRQFLSDKLARDRNISVTADQILLTSGAGQGIHITMEMLLDPGDVVLVDDFTYSGGLAQIKRFRGDPQPVKTDNEGMLPDALEATIQRLLREGRTIKLIYLVPSFQNPQGWSISLERRKAILAAAQRHNLVILEDDSYCDLRYEGAAIPALRTLDEEGHVIYISTFSKTIAPGMRCGYLTASGALFERAMACKSGGPVPLFVSLAIHRYSDQLASHIEQINDIQMSKRNAMLAGLSEHFSDSATWIRPEGGLSIWVKMKQEVDLQAIRDKVFATDNVSYMPGNRFSPDLSTGKNFMRLSYGFNTPEEIYEGMGKLAAAFRREGVL
jgi:2-aminoadipate transaminase